VETVAIKTKAETIGNAPNAITITSHGEILAIDAQQKDLQMQAMVGIEVVTEGALKEDTKGIAMGIVVATVEVAVVDLKETEEEIKVASEEEIVAVTVVDTKETEEQTVEEIVAVTEEITEVEIEEQTVEEIVVVTEEGTEVEPQNPAIGVTVAKAVMEIVDHSVVAIAQRLIQIIRSRTEITNHTVRPHSVQYNSFLRSSLSILDE
jgi:hypothetical protein